MWLGVISTLVLSLMVVDFLDLRWRAQEWCDRDNTQCWKIHLFVNGKRVKYLKSCEDCPLVGVDFSSLDLTGVNLRGANLKDATFKGAVLKGANLSGANARRVKFSLADLSNSNLSAADLDQSDFSGANLNASLLSNSNMQNVNLTDTDLTNASIGGIVNMMGAIFCNTKTAVAVTTSFSSLLSPYIRFLENSMYQSQ